ncbi:MAG: hypothetical protein KF758_07140 [Anaerolineales bacterium]|nr:hypothetical protein [Anaerolineales bacterium]
MNFDYGNILTRTFQTTWKHKVFWGILTIPMLISFAMFPVMFLFLYFFEENQTSEINALVTLGFFFFTFIIVIAFTVLQVFALSAVTLGIVRAERGEGSLRFMDLLQDSREYFWKQLGVFLIIQLSIGLIFTVFFAFVFAATMVTMGMAALCLQPLIILLTPLSFTAIGVLEAAHTAVITENLSAWDAVKRGFEIVREHLWKYLILTVIIYFGITIISSFLMFPMFIPLMGFPIFAESGNEMLMGVTALFTCIFFPVMILISVISQVLLKVSLALTYLRLTHKGENQVIFSETNA